MGIFDALFGTSEDRFHIGGPLGAMFKKNGTAVDVRNADDSGYSTLRVKDPEDDNDAATKLYVDSVEGIMFTDRQADVSTALPNNSAVRGFIVVTTDSVDVPVGSVLYDNGLNDSQPVSVLAPKDGRLIFILTALTGGEITFTPDSIYAFDAPDNVWKVVADIGRIAGAVRCIRYSLTSGGGQSQDSTEKIPAGARILRATIIIKTAFPGSVTLELTNTASTPVVFFPTTKNTPQAVHSYQYSQDGAWGAADSVVRAHFSTATLGTGSADVLVEFSQVLS